jgi:hypothetical protein
VCSSDLHKRKYKYQKIADYLVGDFPTGKKGICVAAHRGFMAAGS